MKQLIESSLTTVCAICVVVGISSVPSAMGQSTEASPYHHKRTGGYRNLPGSPKRTTTRGDVASFLFNQFTRVGTPDVPEGHVVEPGAFQQQFDDAANPSITWLGHASFLIRIGGKIVFTDPFLSERAGPFGFGPKRYVSSPMKATEIPKVDVIVVSHNHYDHLDAGAIADYRFKESVQVIVPLGLAKFFRDRDYPRVLETDWWHVWEGNGLTITTLPSVHFSGRGLFDRNETLWASFAIEGAGTKVWFSGDTATGEVFSEIGRRAGPFDLGLVAIGAYEPRSVMSAVHATPEEAVEIARAVKAKRAIGMHWGTIRLTPEDPFEAPVRFRQAAIEQGYGAENAWVLKVGETRALE